MLILSAKYCKHSKYGCVLKALQICHPFCLSQSGFLFARAKIIGVLKKNKLSVMQFIYLSCKDKLFGLCMKDRVTTRRYIRRVSKNSVNKKIINFVKTFFIIMITKN